MKISKRKQVKTTKRDILALFFSLFFHLLIALIVLLYEKNIKIPATKDRSIAINYYVEEIDKIEKDIESKEEIVENELVKSKKSNENERANIEEMEEIEEVQKENKIEKEELESKEKKSEEPKERDRESDTSKTSPVDKMPSISELSKSLESSYTKELYDIYGKEIESFSKEEIEYLDSHLKDIGAITQRYLKYPNVSIKTKQKGVSVVEFYLYPNGDISGIRILKSSSYSLLDKNSKKTVEIAYKDYPKPIKKTKIIIYIEYRLY